MKNPTKLKVFVLALIIAAGLSVPISAIAQRDVYFNYKSDYLYRNVSSESYILNNQQFGSDAGGGYNLNNQTFGQNQAPLGTGLLILTVVGAGYIVYKLTK